MLKWNYVVILSESARHLQEDAESPSSRKDRAAGFALELLTLERTQDAS